MVFKKKYLMKDVFVIWSEALGRLWPLDAGLQEITSNETNNTFCLKKDISPPQIELQIWKSNTGYLFGLK